MLFEDGMAGDGVEVLEIGSGEAPITRREKGKLLYKRSRRADVFLRIDERAADRFRENGGKPTSEDNFRQERESGLWLEMTDVLAPPYQSGDVSFDKRAS